MIKLKLPETLQLATLKDAPKQEDIIAKIKASENNNIIEGYRIEENSNTNYPYIFFAEINIDNDKLWALFNTMLLSMPDEISLITGHKDDMVDEVHYSNYQDKYTLYNKIEKYEKELTKDGFLQFGIIHQTDNYLEEVFVHSAKYIQYWGMDNNRFVDLMHKFSLYEVDNLEFIDSYPMVTTALFTLEPNVIHTSELLNILRTDI